MNPSETTTDVYRCNRCGFCQQVCPTYSVTGQEFAVARGRNRLLRLAAEGRLTLGGDREVEEHLYSCLLCGACVTVCPPGVATDRLILAARAELTARTGRPFLARSAVAAGLTGPRRVAAFARLLGFYDGSGLRRLVRGLGLSPLGLLGTLDDILPLPRLSLRAKLDRGRFGGGRLDRRRLGRLDAGRVAYRSPPASQDPEARRRVVYFLGCITDSLFPAVGEAVIGVLERNGYEVIVPENVCCGVAHRAYGDTARARRLARVNTSLLQTLEPEVIVSDCASCLDSLKGYPELLEGAPEGEAAKRLAGMVREISEFLVGEGFRPPAKETPGIVTYHDPCHLSRGLGVRRPPRELLAGLPGAEYREMEEADWCCGGAGSYNLTHPDLASRIIERKIEHVRQTGATILTTSCPSCLLQLGLGLRRAKLAVTLAHPVELLWRAYG